MSPPGKTLALTVLVVAALTAVSTPARATVVWTATLEKGDLSEWTSTTNGTKTLPDGSVRKNIEVVGEKVYSGKLACKVTVHPDDDFGQYHQDRADIKHDSTLTGEGKDSYLSGFYFLPEDAKTRDEILFYETKVTSHNQMDLWIEPKTGGGTGTTVKFGIESNGANLGSVLVWTGDWKAGAWHQFAIHVHWSIDAAKGLVDLWLDGQQVVTNYKHKTKYDANDLFVQTGLHRVLMQPSTETIYFDDFIEADTLAEIKIGAPTPGGADGGVTDAGGAGTDGGAGGAAGMTGAGGAGGATGAAGSGAAGTTGAAGSAGMPGAAGVTGAAGTTGVAGTTGAGGSGGTTGAAGSGTPPRADGSGGCACALDRDDHAGGLGALAMLGLGLAFGVRGRKRGAPHPREAANSRGVMPVQRLNALKKAGGSVKPMR
jgi:MYXO-CTERM domain-containing protein